MKFIETKLKDCYLIELEPNTDERGWFSRFYCKNEFQRISHYKEWVQMNHSFTKKKGTIRGMHYQIDPYEEIKMIRCIAGAVFDVAIDLRKESPTYLQYFGTILSSENKKLIYIPAGFAHGFQTLEDNSELIYHHSAYYTPKAEGGLLYNDPKLNIKWPFTLTEISERDKKHPLIQEQFKEY